MTELSPDNPTGMVNGENGSRRRKALFILVFVVLAGLVTATMWWMHNQKIVRTENAKVVGHIVDISSRVGGRLDQIAVQEQDTIHQGQLLAQLDSIPYYNTLGQAEAGLETAQANYAKLPTDIKSMYSLLTRAEEGVRTAEAGVKAKSIAVADARRAAEQTEKLFAQGAVSREQLDLSRSRLAAAEAALEAAQAEEASARASLLDAESKGESMQKTGSAIYLAQLKQAKAAVDMARYNLDQTAVKAPQDGIVLRIPVEQGENISPGQIIVTVCDLKNTWVVANIEENKINRIKVGQAVEVRIDAYPGQILAGKVEAIGGAAQSVFALIPAENTSGNFTKVVQRLPVKIKVEPASVILKPGMSAQVVIRTR